MHDFVHLPALRYHVERDPTTGEREYVLETPFHYASPRYGKSVYLEAGTRSDGATGAFDIHSRSWWVHDELCRTGQWADGTPCTNWQASSVLADILRLESRPFRSIYWWTATWLFGGGKARDNGLWPWS